MHVIKKIVVVFLLAYSTVFASELAAQSAGTGLLTIDGVVYGYNYEPSKKLLLKDKQIKVEGLLDNVEVVVKDKGKVVRSTKTKLNGTFSMQVKTDKVYTLEFSKAGYSTAFFTIDLTSAPAGVGDQVTAFSGAEFILNSYQSKNKTEFNFSVGKLFYNTKGNYVDFETAKFLSKKEREYVSNPVSMIMRSVQKNRNVNKTVAMPVELEVNPGKSKKNKVEVKREAEVVAPVDRYDSIQKRLTELRSRSRFEFEKVTDSDIESLQKEIDAARVRYENDKRNARSPGDSLRLKIQEESLTSMELELFSAKKLIDLQRSEISAQKKLLYLAIAFVALLLTMLFLVFRFNKQKKKSYLLLKEKNRKITDSINYASRIQESILPSLSEMKELLPRSFVYYEPRDVVSGDFYWLSTLNEKTVIACVDCTGHGVPGAFMSLIGNTLLNEIVNERKIIDPSQILKQLHLEIVKSLHQNTGRSQSKDGMEMSLCVIDPTKQTIEFAGAMNPVYVVKGGVVNLIHPDLNGIGGESVPGKNEEFTTRQIPMEKNMSLYMFTDGYMDQFGGPENKKFNIPNFKKLLLEMQSEEMEKQGEIVRDTIQKWKGHQKQIDDMLVIGLRF